MKARAIIVLLTSVLVASFAHPAGAAATSATTLTYCTHAGVALKLDLYRPAGNKPMPVVVAVHGGGWYKGDRFEDVTPKLVAGFLNAHLAFASVDYRLGNGPDAIADVACAVRFLRARFASVGAMGRSAGAQIVSLLATAPRYADSRPDAVVDKWGPVIFDAPLMHTLPRTPSVFGTSDLHALARWSPLSYVTADDPPFLLVHGAQDPTVPVSQSRTFAAALAHAHVPERLIVVAHAGHGLIPVGGAPSPSVVNVQASVVTFFAKALAG